MNAVTTTEYVVLEEIHLSDIQREINNLAKGGWKLTHFESHDETSYAAASYNAVMVREPSPAYFTELQNRIADLETRLQALDANYENTRQQVISHESVRLGTRSRLESLETRCNEIEAKIDWSK